MGGLSCPVLGVGWSGQRGENGPPDWTKYNGIHDKIVHSASFYKATDHHQDERSGGFLLLLATTFQNIKNAASLLQSKQQCNLSYRTSFLQKRKTLTKSYNKAPEPKQGYMYTPIAQ